MIVTRPTTEELYDSIKYFNEKGYILSNKPISGPSNSYTVVMELQQLKQL